MRDKVVRGYKIESQANLTGADLTGADLTRADLRSANLTGADLTRADLTRADLTGADLRSADLTRADLRSADLRSANLRSANLNNTRLAMYSKHSISWLSTESYTIEKCSIDSIYIKIGCREKTIKNWDYFFSDDCKQEYETSRESFEFKMIKANYKAIKTYLEELYK